MAEARHLLTDDVAHDTATSGRWIFSKSQLSIQFTI